VRARCGGFVYARLRDANTGEEIDARVPEQLAAALEWNREAVFVGLLRFKPGRGGVLKPEFRIDSVGQLGTTDGEIPPAVIDFDFLAGGELDLAALPAGQSPLPMSFTPVPVGKVRCTSRSR
jgi:hypothetical protein